MNHYGVSNSGPASNQGGYSTNYYGTSSDYGYSNWNYGTSTKNDGQNGASTQNTYGESMNNKTPGGSNNYANAGNHNSSYGNSYDAENVYISGYNNPNYGVSNPNNFGNSGPSGSGSGVGYSDSSSASNNYGQNNYSGSQNQANRNFAAPNGSSGYVSSHNAYGFGGGANNTFTSPSASSQGPKVGNVPSADYGYGNHHEGFPGSGNQQYNKQQNKRNQNNRGRRNNKNSDAFFGMHKGQDNQSGLGGWGDFKRENKGGGHMNFTSNPSTPNKPKSIESIPNTSVTDNSTPAADNKEPMTPMIGPKIPPPQQQLPNQFSNHSSPFYHKNNQQFKPKQKTPKFNNNNNKRNFQKSYDQEVLDQILQGRNAVAYLNEKSKPLNLNLTFEMMSEVGPPHDKQFTFRVILGESYEAIGTACSKKEAKIKSAEELLLKLDKIAPDHVELQTIVLKTPYRRDYSNPNQHEQHQRGKPPVDKKRKKKTTTSEYDMTKDERMNAPEINAISKLFEYAKKSGTDEPIFEMLGEVVLEQTRTAQGFMLKRSEYSMKCMFNNSIYTGLDTTKKGAKLKAAEMAFHEISQEAVLAAMSKKRKAEEAAKAVVAASENVPATTPTAGDAPEAL